MNTLLAALLLLAEAAAPQISHEAIGDGRYRLRLEAAGITEVTQGQALLLPEARRLCGALTPYFGHYEWDGRERMATPGAAREAVSLILRQDLTCGAPAPAPAETAAAPDPAWRPDAAQEAAVLAAARRYYAARDAGRYAEAHAMWTASNQATMPRDSWSAEARAFNDEAGAGRGMRLIRVTWYVNPPGAPVAGIYAAVDFSGDYAGLHFFCGYAVWLLQPDGSWRLTREERNLISRARAPNATAAEIAQFRTQFCRD